MNEETRKLRIGRRKEKRRNGWNSYFVKPSGKFWKRYFNKKVRHGQEYKKSNWFEWC